MDTLKRTAPSCAALGLGVGLFVGITGVGGGSPMAPLLILLFGIQPATTIGTVVNGLHRTVAWRPDRPLAGGSLPTATVTLFLVPRMDLQNQTANVLIRVVLAATLAACRT